MMGKRKAMEGEVYAGGLTGLSKGWWTRWNERIDGGDRREEAVVVMVVVM